MGRTKLKLIDLIDRYQASSAEWHYVEDTKHVTKGVMHWIVILFNATVPNEYGRHRLVKTHVIELANCCDLIVDEYLARLVINRFERAT
jgi:hypothetical protein